MQLFAAILAPVLFFVFLLTPKPVITGDSKPTLPPIKSSSMPISKVSLMPKSTPVPSKVVQLSDSLFLDSINSYRVSKGLSLVSSDFYTCSFAKLRAKEISTNFNHDGFNNRLTSKYLSYPSFHVVIENIAMTSNRQDVINLWINSPGHAANMQKDTPFVCVQNYGDYYAYEGYKQ